MDTRSKSLFKKTVNLITVFSFLFWNLASAAPEGGQVVAGSANISQQNSQTVINQNTQSAVINWTSFNTSAAESVKFNQPNSSAVALNKITNGLPTNFNGGLSANGQVWIINPNGVLFGSSANINVGGLLATTHNINNADFMSGKYNFEVPTDLSASIINNGNITAADSGIVALVAPSVINNGIITANFGKVSLSTGAAYTLDLYGDQLINFGSNAAIQNGSISNAGQVIANGGKVFMTANYASGVLNNLISMTGSIQAQSVGTNNKGEIVLYGGDYQHKTLAGTTYVSGKLDASNTVSGNAGGSIETSGGYVYIDPNAVINAGAGGSWTLDPNDILINNTSNSCTNPNTCSTNYTATGASTVGTGFINAQLNAFTSVTLTASGDIDITSPITMTNAGSSVFTTLTLNAGGNVNIDAAINLRPSGGPFEGAALVINANTIFINTPVLSFGGVSIGFVLTGFLFHAPVVLQSDVTFNGDAYNEFFSTIQSSVPGAFGLTLNEGGGLTYLDGDIGGGGNTLAFLTTGGNFNFNGIKNITTTGAQTFNSSIVFLNPSTSGTFTGTDVYFNNGLSVGATSAPVTVNGNAHFQGTVAGGQGPSVLTVNGDTFIPSTGATLDAVSLINFNGNLNSEPSQSGVLNINVFNTEFGGVVNGVTPLGSLSLNSPNITLNGGTIIQANQTYGSGGTFFVTALGGTLDDSGTTTFTNISYLQGPGSLTINGNAVFNGAFDFITPLNNLTVTGTTNINTYGVNTAGTQKYEGSVLMSYPNLITLVGSNIEFDSAVNSSGTPSNININGNLVLGNSGSIGQSSNIAQLIVLNGYSASLGGNITTTGNTTFTGPVILTNDTSITDTGAGITFGSTIDNCLGITCTGGAGPFNLTVTENGLSGIRFSGSIGSNAALGALTTNLSPGNNATINYSNIINYVVNTVNNQTYNGDVQLGGSATLTSSAGNIRFAKALDGNGGLNYALMISSNVGSVEFDRNVGGSAPFAVLDVTAGNGIIINPNILSNPVLSIITTGNQIYNGNIQLTTTYTTPGTVPSDILQSNSGDITLNGPVSLIYPGGEVSLFINAANNVYINNSISMNPSPNSPGEGGYLDVTAGGKIYINTSNIEVGSAGDSNTPVPILRSLEFHSPVLLQQDLTIISSSWGHVTVDSTIDTDPLAISEHSLTMIAPTLVDIYGSMGVNRSLSAIDIETAVLRFLGNGSFQFITTGNQTYSQTQFDSLFTAIVLGATDITFTSTNNGLVSIIGGLHSFLFSTSLQINGNAYLQGNNFSNPNFYTNGLFFSIVVTGDTEFDNAIINTKLSNQLYQGNVTVTNNGASLTTSGAVIEFGGNINSVTGNNSAVLNLSTPFGGYTQFDGVVNVGASTDSLFALNGFDPFVFNGSTFNVNNFTFGSAIGITALGGVVNPNTLVTFNNTIDGFASGNSGTLSVNGNAVINNTIGGSQPLFRLYVSGNTSLGANINTYGDTEFGGPVTLTSNSVITDTGTGIKFDSTVDSNSFGPWDLTLNATAGPVEFDGNVGASLPLSVLNVTAGTQINVSASLINTLNDQNYNGTVFLMNLPNFTFTGSTIWFKQGLKAYLSSPNLVDIKGNLVLGDRVGGFGAFIDNLLVEGATTIGTDLIQTNVSQVYQGPVTLSSPALTVQLNVVNGGSLGVEFDSTVDGANTLLLSGNGGNLSLFGNVGTSIPLTAILFNQSGLMTTIGGVLPTTTVRTSQQQYWRNMTVQGNASFISDFNNIVFFQSIVTTVPGVFDFTVNASAIGFNDVSGVFNILNLTGTNGISQGPSGSVSANSLIAHSDSFIDFSTATNFVNAFNATNTAGFNISLKNSGLLNITGITQFGLANVNVDNTGDIVLSGLINAPSRFVYLTSTGMISDTALGAVNVLFLNTHSVTGTDLTLGTHTMPYFSATNSSSGDIKLNHSGALTLEFVTVNNGNLDVVNAGPISQFGFIVVSGSSSFDAGSNSIDLYNNAGGNSLQGPIILSNTGGNNVDIYNETTLILAPSNIGNNLSVYTNGSGINILGNIISGGSQSYHAPVAIVNAGAVTFTGTDIIFYAPVESSGTPAQITIAGNLVIDNASSIGASGDVSSLYVTGTTRDGGNITTTNDPTFVGAYYLTNNVVITDLSINGIIFMSTVDNDAVFTGPWNLTLNVALAPVQFDGDVGTINGPLQSLTVNGTTLINGATQILTNGNQIYSDTVTINNSVTMNTLVDGDIQYNGGGIVDAGANTLTASSADAAKGPVGHGITGKVNVGGLNLSGPGGANLSENYPVTESFVNGQGGQQARTNTISPPDVSGVVEYCVNGFNCGVVPPPTPNTIPNNVPPTQIFNLIDNPKVCDPSGCSNLAVVFDDVAEVGIVNCIVGFAEIVDQAGQKRIAFPGVSIYAGESIVADVGSQVCVKTIDSKVECKTAH